MILFPCAIQMFPINSGHLPFWDENYLKAGLGGERNLSLIPDFNTLIAKSQKARTPVFALTKKQMERGGVVLKKTIENRDAFKRLFEDLAEKVIKLAEA